MTLNLQKYLQKIENSNKNNTNKKNITLKFREKELPIQEGFVLYNPNEIKNNNKYKIVNKNLKFRKLYPENNEEKSLLTNFQSNISGNNTLGGESIIFLNMGKNYMLRIAKKNQDETLKSCLIHKLLTEKYADNNDHILKIYEFGVLSPEKRIYSILERCDGDLFNYIYSINKSVESFIDIIYKMTKSISYLHENNLVHLDIKLENFLYKINNKEVDVKITDFGTAEFEGTVLHMIRGTKSTIAPEFLNKFYIYKNNKNKNQKYIFNENGKYIANKKADIFSLGVCFLYFFIWIFANRFLDFYAPINKEPIYRIIYYNKLYKNDMIYIFTILSNININIELRKVIYTIFKKTLASVEDRYNDINELLDDIEKLKIINNESPKSVVDSLLGKRKV